MNQVQIVGTLYRIIWILLIVVTCLWNNTPWSYACIIPLFIYCCAAVSYCEAISDHPAGNRSTETWMWVSKAFSYIASLAFVLLLIGINLCLI